MVVDVEDIPLRVVRLLLVAQKIAEGTPDFFKVKGPGVGDRAANEFTRVLREKAKDILGADLSEKQVCKGINFRFDFYFPEEGGVVEFAFGLHHPQSEFEKDIFKCLLASDAGCKINNLLFVAKPGGAARLKAAGQRAIADLVKKKFGLTVGVWELVPRDESSLPQGEVLA